MTRRVVAPASLVAMFVLLAMAQGTSGAVADGEAGVVVAWGDGTSSSYCVAFEGDSVSGADLLSAAGLGTTEFSGLVCSINDVGCTHSGNFNSCLCQCQTGSPDCIYWSFFTRDYGAPWRYSATGFRSVSSSNGDLQAWQWLPASSAAPPRPPSATFEDVCGHPPVIATPAAAVPAIPPASTVAGQAGSPSITATVAPTAPAATSSSQPDRTLVATTATPAPPSGGHPGPDGGNGSGTWLRFGAVAAALVALLSAALAVRARRGD